MLHTPGIFCTAFWRILRLYLAMILDAISEEWPEWENFKVNAEEWIQLRNELRKNAASLLGMLKQKSDYAGRERDFALGSLAHTAFHLGVIQVKYDLLKNSK